MKQLALYFQANRLEKKAQWQQAAAIYKKIASVAKDNSGRLAYRQGMMAEKLKDWPNAQQFFSQAVAKRPHDANCFYHLGLAYEYDKKYQQAAKALEKSLAIKPNNPYALRHLGKVLIYGGDPAEGEGKLYQAIALRPDIDIFWQDLITAIRRQGRTWQEVEILQKRIEQQGKNVQLYFELGEAQDKMNRFAEAAQAFAQANVIRPGDAMWHFREGYAWERADEAEKAQIAYTAAIAADQDLQAQSLGIGVFHQQRGFWPQAAEAYTKAAAADPTNAELQYRLGLAHDRCYRWEQATRCYRQALALDTTQANWHYRLGFVLERQELLEQAAQAYEYAATTHNKHIPYWFYRLGYVLAQAGKYKQACSAFLNTRTQASLDALPMLHAQTALSLDYQEKLKASVQAISPQAQIAALHSDNPAAAFYKLGNQAERLQMWEEAAQAYRDAVARSNNHNGLWYYRLGYVLMQMGLYEGSVRAYESIDLLSGFRKRIGKEIAIEIADLTYENNCYEFVASYKNNSKINTSIKIKRLVLQHRMRIGNEYMEFYVKPDAEFLTIDTPFTFKFDLNSINLDLHYWDLRADLEVLDRTYGDVDVRTKNIRFSPSVLEKIKRCPYRFSTRQQENIVIPYINNPGTRIALLKRPWDCYDDPLYLERESRALAEYEKNKDELDAHKSWLIFEKYSKTAQDNAYYFFLYAVKRRPHVYFIIEKDSPDRKNLTGYEENIVEFMSIEHMKLLLSCETIISSESRGHGYAWRRVFGEYRVALLDKKFIFLQHGVIGLKKLDSIFKKTDKSFAANKFIASNSMEAKFIMDDFGYDEDDLIISGLPRWDSLQSNFPVEDEIFLMPTWRNWLEDISEEKFLETDYFKNYISLLNSKAFFECLKKFNTKLNFYLHPKISKHVSKFEMESKYVRIVGFGEFSIRELLQRAKILITDYSSVAWDFIYLGKPVLFYHFDLDDYEKYQGAYINLRTDLPGKVAYNEQDLIALFEQQLEGISNINTKASDMKNKYFPNITGNACETIYQTLIGER